MGRTTELTLKAFLIYFNGPTVDFSVYFCSSKSTVFTENTSRDLSRIRTTNSALLAKIFKAKISSYL